MDETLDLIERVTKELATLVRSGCTATNICWLPGLRDVMHMSDPVRDPGVGKAMLRMFLQALKSLTGTSAFYKTDIDAVDLQYCYAWLFKLGVPNLKVDPRRQRVVVRLQEVGALGAIKPSEWQGTNKKYELALIRILAEHLVMTFEAQPRAV